MSELQKKPVAIAEKRGGLKASLPYFGGVVKVVGV
jgi:hypothetical protein